jgi:isopentenyl-diphosphate delta-isomerase
MKEEKVILVDEQDRVLGTMPKLEAHEKAVLHRAFSVFILNDKGELLLQQRAHDKYHSPGLWTNSCCSHQREGESSLDAGKRRLKEEMGMTAELTELFTFIYKAPFDNGLTEHELDHVLLGYSNATPNINPEEVADYTWETLAAVQKGLEAYPDRYTAWFKIIFNRFFEHIQNITT